MVRRRALTAGITTEVCNHTFRGTGITAYLENGGTLEKARQMAAQPPLVPRSFTIGARTG
jgi:integrase/recombinase XerD